MTFTLFALFLLLFFCIHIFSKLFEKLLCFYQWKFLFQTNLLAIYVHELFHFLMALVFLKWPKFTGVRTEYQGSKIRISGGVNVQTFSYKMLGYNLLNHSFFVASFLFIYQLISSFFIAFAPMVFSYALLFFFLQYLGVQTVAPWEMTNISYETLVGVLPVMYFAALVSFPSWQDVKVGMPFLPFLFFLSYEPLESYLIFLCSWLLAAIVIVFLFLNASKIVFRRRL